MGAGHSKSEINAALHHAARSLSHDDADHNGIIAVGTPKRQKSHALPFVESSSIIESPVSRKSTRIRARREVAESPDNAVAHPETQVEARRSSPPSLGRARRSAQVVADAGMSDRHVGSSHPHFKRHPTEPHYFETRVQLKQYIISDMPKHGANKMQSFSRPGQDQDRSKDWYGLYQLLSSTFVQSRTTLDTSKAGRQHLPMKKSIQTMHNGLPAGNATPAMFAAIVKHVKDHNRVIDIGTAARIATGIDRFVVPHLLSLLAALLENYHERYSFRIDELETIVVVMNLLSDSCHDAIELLPDSQESITRLRCAYKVKDVIAAAVQAFGTALETARQDRAPQEARTAPAPQLHSSTVAQGQQQQASDEVPQQESAQTDPVRQQRQTALDARRQTVKKAKDAWRAHWKDLQLTRNRAYRENATISYDYKLDPDVHLQTRKTIPTPDTIEAWSPEAEDAIYQSLQKCRGERFWHDFVWQTCRRPKKRRNVPAPLENYKLLEIIDHAMLRGQEWRKRYIDQEAEMPDCLEHLWDPRLWRSFLTEAVDEDEAE